MGKKKNKVTKFLEKNNIWFTTVASIALAIMALILSINSNNLTERQTLMDYANYHPEFQIHKYTSSSRENEIIDDLNIIIKNKNNGVARNLEISVKMFLDIKINQKNISMSEILSERDFETKRFFLLDQFNSFIYSNENEIIIKSPSYRHGTKVKDSIYGATQEQRFQLYSYILNQELEKNNLFASFTREMIIKLSYTNFMKKNIVEYYKLNLYRIEEELLVSRNNINAEYIESDSEAQKLFNPSKKLNYVSFVSIQSPEDFLERFYEEKAYSYDKLDIIRFQDIYSKSEKKPKSDLDSIPKTKPEDWNKKRINELLNEMNGPRK